MQEIRIKLQEKQKVFLQTIEATPVTFFGGAKGGGKSGGLRRIMLARRLKYPNSHGAIFRRTFPELYGNHIQKLFEEFPMLRPYYNDSKKIVNFPNGSTLQFCHCNNEADISLYQGREFHDLAIDESGQWPESMYATLRGSNRSSNPGIPARTILTGNPGGIGHNWLKRLFVERRFNERERPGDYAFIQAFVADNPALLANDPEYVHRLEAEPNEALRRAYLLGDWDIFAGQFFGEIRREVHFINPIDIPKHWKRFGAYDYGYGHPAAFGWFAVDEDGNVFMYRELIQAKTRVDQFAQLVKQAEDVNKLEYIVAGLDCWIDKRTGMSSKGVAPTIAEEFMNNGINLSKANVGRIQGASQVRNYLAWQDLPDGREQPRFFIFNTCPLTFDCLTRMEHDPKKIEDVLKIDATEGDPQTGDDPYDMVRYALMSRPPLADRPKKKLPHGTKAWADEEIKKMEQYVLDQYQQKKDELGGLKFSDDPWANNPTSFDNDW